MRPITYLLVAQLSMALCVHAQQKPEKTPARSRLSIPVGMDAYRRWDLLPLQRIGVRAYMRSTYDRAGGSYDASHFLFMNKEDENVTLDVKGRGMLYFFRANHWHGSPWHFVVDGNDNIVQESATADPVNAEKNLKTTAFMPAPSFSEPWAWTWGTTKGADLIWTPMPFEHSMRIAYSRTFYGTGYYIYHLYANEAALSGNTRSWQMDQEPDKEATTLLASAGKDIAPNDIAARRGRLKLNKEKITVATIRAAPSSVRALKLVLPANKAELLERIHLRVTWDDASHPSIDAPLCLFFGAGTFYNREKKEWLVKGLPINVRYDYAGKKVELSCYYPMPFFRSARFELTGITPDSTEIGYEIRYEPLSTVASQSSYFHATYRDIPRPEYGKDMVWLDTKGEEGHGEWSGSFLGTSFIFSHNANLNTLEGDPRFFFDDSQTPQAYGTGTEEWAGGGDYWGGENMTLPLAGHPCGSTKKETALNEKDLIQSAYRFLVADLMPFGRRAVIRFEHSENISREHYESVTYWYGLPAPSLVLTDSIDIGQVQDEQRHHYYSPQASEPATIRSRYEWGPDTYPANAWGYKLDTVAAYKELIHKEIFPPHDEDGRYTRGESEFTVKLDAHNKGALLRRTLDYGYPNQTAEVYIRNAATGKQAGDSGWKKAGTWYLAGSNTCMVSRPPGELSPRKYDLQTSNRRFRDDEFLVPAELTKGLSTIRVRIRFIPDTQQLYPGHDFPNQSAWSELKYQVYSYILPHFNK